MVVQKNTPARNKKTVRKQAEPKAATTLFRVICLVAAIILFILDATITTFDYPVWVLGILMGIVIGLSPEDLRDWFRGKSK